MKAIVVNQFGDESVLQQQDIAVPEPGENEVRVRLHAAGVNPVETYIRAGHYSPLPPLPTTPGNDGAGKVDKIGSGVTQVREGDRVFVAATLARRNTGTYAEHVVCDADAVHPLPESMPFSQGAGLGTPGFAALDALFVRARIRPGETVLIHGASGGVGTVAVQLARRAGARVFGTAGSAEGEALVAALGAHQVFNHRADGYIDKIREASGDGVNAVIEMAADRNLAKDCSMVATRGRIVVVGNRSSLDFNPRDAMARDVAILGMSVPNMSREEGHEVMALFAAALETGLHVVVSAEVPLADASQAHRLVTEGKQNGKVILTMA